MSDVYLYDVFISYATVNEEIANKVVSLIERRGYKCFIAPRDIVSGKDYASEIIRGISNSLAVLLICSTASDKSGYVLREINSAVARNKTIIPLRIESFIPSEAMEFYLGPTQWLDAFPHVLDTHIDSVVRIIDGIKNTMIKAPETESIAVKYSEPTIIKLSEALNIGYDYKNITLKEIEISYLCVPTDKFEWTIDVDRDFNDWKDATCEYEEDTSALLVKDDQIIGYCDMYPLENSGYEEVISGKKIVTEDMIDLYSFGGEFNAYIAMLVIIPEYSTQNNYLKIFKWIRKHLIEWKEQDIIINNIGISVYNNMLEKFVIKLGFDFKCLNPINGKVYEIPCSKLLQNMDKNKLFN